MALRPDSDSWPALQELRSHTHWTHQNRYDSAGRVINPTHRPLRDNTQQPQEKNFHVTGGTGTRNPRKRRSAHPRIRVHTPCWTVNAYRQFGGSFCLQIKRPSVQKRWSELKMKYPSPKVGKYLVFATRHGINISKDMDFYFFARSSLWDEGGVEMKV